jgi:hypothetical protein
LQRVYRKAFLDLNIAEELGDEIALVQAFTHRDESSITAAWIADMLSASGRSTLRSDG